MLSEFKQSLMLPQFTLGVIETAFNALLQRSPQALAPLRKLNGRILQIQLTTPDLTAFLVFSERRVDWLQRYEGEADCSVQLAWETLPQLADKQKLTGLINDKSLILNGDIQVIQYFTALLEQLEKDPAELLSPFVGDVIAQSATECAKKLLYRLKAQGEQNGRHLVDSLMNERPVLVHRLQAVDFYDQIAELEKQTAVLVRRFEKLETSS